MTFPNTQAVNVGELSMYVPWSGRDESCYVRRATAQTISFGGKYISLSAISRTTGINASHLSRIFRNERQPSVPFVRKISAALAMEIQEFIDALGEHFEDIKRKKAGERKNRVASIRRNEAWLRRRGLL